MKKVMQTRFSFETTKGNCLAAVVASIMEKDNAEDVIQIQEYYDNELWGMMLLEWLDDNGYDYYTINGHLYDDTYYFVSGLSPRNRNITHICIYQNGIMVHDPHPDGTGILNCLSFSQITKK
jgi:hypothetical protein